MSTELLRRAAKEMRKDSEALIDILPRQLDYNLAIAEWLTSVADRAQGLGPGGSVVCLIDEVHANSIARAYVGEEATS